MRILLALLFAVVGMLLALISLPWVVMSIGFSMMGDKAASDRWDSRSPLNRYWDWREARAAAR